MKRRDKRVVVLIGIFLAVTSSLFAQSATGAETKDCAALIKGINARYKGELNQAVEAFRRAIYEQGDAATAYLHLGLTYELKGQKQKAVEYYRKALQIRPSYKCAHYYLVRAQKASQRPRLVDQALESVTPDEIMHNFSRYRGKQLRMKGRMMCWPCSRGRNPIILVTTKPEESVRSDAAMEGVLVIKLKKPLPDDPRIATGANIEVRGIVTDREFVFHPHLKVSSTRRRPVITPEVITISDSRSFTGPLTLRMER